jgi:hypothetical protein
MDRKSIEEKLVELEREFECLQEPVHRVFETIEKLMDKTKDSKNPELMEFKLELSKIVGDFYEQMVCFGVHRGLTGAAGARIRRSNVEGGVQEQGTVQEVIRAFVQMLNGHWEVAEV